MLLKSRVNLQTHAIQQIWRRRRGDSNDGSSPTWIIASRRDARRIDHLDPVTCLAHHRLHSSLLCLPLLALTAVMLATARSCHCLRLLSLTAVPVRSHRHCLYLFIFSDLLCSLLPCLFSPVLLMAALFIFSDLFCSSLPYFIMASSDDCLLIQMDFCGRFICIKYLGIY